MGAAQSKSKEKLFSKPLKDTDIKKRLAIPTKTLPSLPSFNGGHAVDIQLVHDSKTWPITCTVRRKGRHSKPVFSGGWRKFVTANKLKVGDKITMYKVQDEDGKFSHYMVELEQPAIRNQEQPPEATDESIEQEGANVAVDTQLDDVHVITKLSPVKVFGLDEAEPPLVAIKENEINFFGLAHQEIDYGYRHDTIHQLATEQMNLDLTLAPPNA